MGEWRPMVDSDRAFVASSWVKSYAASEVARICSPGSWPRASSVYWQGQHALVDRLLARADVRVVETDGLISGWACLEPGALHYVYVRQIDRGRGVVRRLLGDLVAEDVLYTHRSRALDAARVPVRWRFDPYWLMTKGTT